MNRVTRGWMWLGVLCFALVTVGAAGAQEVAAPAAPAADAAGADAAADLAAAPEDWFGGSVTGFDAGTLDAGPAELKVKDEEGTEKGFWIAKDTPVYVDGEDGKAGDIKAGDEVELSYEVKDGKNTVIDLDVFRNLDFEFEDEEAAAGAAAPAAGKDEKKK